MDSWLITLVSVLILLLLLVSIVLFHVRSSRNLIYLEWKKLWLLLYHRHNLLPNFLETFKTFFPGEVNKIQELINSKNTAAVLNSAGNEKMRAELDLSLKLSEIMQLCNTSKDILVDTNFLELRQELKENAENIETEIVAYNTRVRSFNDFLKKIKPFAFIFRIKSEQIFEFEAGF